MPDQNPESRPSVGGVLDDLKKAFGWSKSSSAEAVPAASAPAAPALTEATPQPKKAEEAAVLAPEQVVSVSASDEDAAPDWLTLPAIEPADQIALAESLNDTLVHPQAAPTVTGLQLTERPVIEEPEIPDWLKVPPPLQDSTLKTLGPFDSLPPAVVEEKVKEEKVEDDPFAANKELNGYMETIRQVLETLASGTALNPDQEKQAKIAAGKANTLLPKLPADVLQSVILMKAVSSNNPKYGRHDFQREMLAVVDIIKGGVVKKV